MVVEFLAHKRTNPYPRRYMEFFMQRRFPNVHFESSITQQNLCMIFVQLGHKKRLLYIDRLLHLCWALKGSNLGGCVGLGSTMLMSCEIIGCYYPVILKAWPNIPDREGGHHSNHLKGQGFNSPSQKGHVFRTQNCQVLIILPSVPGSKLPWK